MNITIPRAVVEQALEALEIGYEVAKAEADRYHTAMAGFRPERHAKMDAEVQQIAQSITALRAALAQLEGGGNLPPPLQEESTVAEKATTQQPIEQTPPSDYRRGYWAGFAIGKREGRIEAEAALAQPEPEPGTCTWWQDGDSDSGIYQTSCGHYFAITDGTPEDNKMRHCCYCGKTLAQELITEDEDE